MPPQEADHDFRSLWTIEEDVHFLNHGSFGGCPRVILDELRHWQERLEAQPLRFLGREVEEHTDRVREALGRFLHAPADDLALVPNATGGVNTVLRSLTFQSGDEILVTDHGYNACSNAARFVAERCGARVVEVPLPFPIREQDEVMDAIMDAIMDAVTPRTRLVLLDAITSPTGLVLPYEQLVRELNDRGVDTLVDGAHAPGMLDLHLETLGAAYFTGNCHKWMCTPKGSAFLYVRPDRQEPIRPLIISHGANSTRTDRSRFRLEFDWPGTFDPSPWLCIPKAIEWFDELLEGGWQEMRERNHRMVCEGRKLLCAALEIDDPAPEHMLGFLATVPLPDDPSVVREPPLFLDPAQIALLDKYRVEVPIMSCAGGKGRLLRISAQLYNRREEYEVLAAALPRVLGRA